MATMWTDTPEGIRRLREAPNDATGVQCTREHPTGGSFFFFFFCLPVRLSTQVNTVFVVWEYGPSVTKFETVCMNQCSYQRAAESRRERHLVRCCLLTYCIPRQAGHCSREQAQKRRAFAHLAMLLWLQWLFHQRGVTLTLGFYSQTRYHDLPR